jgi:hypothetical protein
MYCLQYYVQENESSQWRWILLFCGLLDYAFCTELPFFRLHALMFFKSFHVPRAAGRLFCLCSSKLSSGD